MQINETSRRAILAGAGAASAALALPAFPATAAVTAVAGRGAWDAARLKMDAAKAADDAINARYEATPKNLRSSALVMEWEARGDRLWEAEWELFDTPAADLNALRWKIELLASKRLVLDDAFLTVILADVRRLNGEG